jgi:hypothetical protein
MDESEQFGESIEGENYTIEMKLTLGRWMT